MQYGTGAIFGCPSGDQRDLDFARKYGLDITPVVLPPDGDAATFEVGDEAYTGPGTIFNSGFLDGLSTTDAIAKAIGKIEGDGPRQGRHPISPARLGAYPASAIGAARSRRSIARNAALCPCRKKTCR